MKQKVCSVLGTMIIFCPFFVTAQACSESTKTQDPTGVMIWPSTVPGPYSVGYRVMHEYDPTRTFKPKVDYFGKPTRGPISRPLQISVWYPAERPAGPSRMRLEEYYQALATETEFTTPTSDQVKIVLNRLRQSWPIEFRVAPEGRQAIRERIDEELKKEVFAMRDANPAKGPFPLIVHMPGYDGSPAGHAFLFEYLASHGYVVAAVPNMGMYRRNIDNEAASLDVQARDLEFVVAHMGKFPYVDPSRIGTTGMSWGGMSNVLFAERDAHVDAALTLDGAITMPEELKLIEAIPGYSHKSFDKAYMQLLVSPAEAKFRPKDLRFYESLEYGDAHMIQFRGVDHDEFSCGYLRLRNLKETDPMRIADLEEFTREIYDCSLRFFNAYFKGDAEALRSLAAQAETPADSAARSEMVALRHYKKGRRRPLTRDEFVDIVKTRGAEEALRIYIAYCGTRPQNDLIVSSVIGPVYMDAIESGDLKEALAICKLWETGLPNEPGPLFSMARVYAETGETDKAIQCYERILAMGIEGRSADIARERLQALRSKK